MDDKEFLRARKILEKTQITVIQIVIANSRDVILPNIPPLSLTDCNLIRALNRAAPRVFFLFFVTNLTPLSGANMKHYDSNI